MPQGDKNKKKNFVCKNGSMALYQKLDFIRSTIYVKSSIIVSRSAQNA